MEHLSLYTKLLLFTRGHSEKFLFSNWINRIVDELFDRKAGNLAIGEARVV